MYSENSNPADALGASLCARNGHAEEADLQGVYTVTCRDADGHVKWTETFDNLVTTQGKNAALDTFLGRGAAYANVYLSLITSGTPVAGDTYAAHAGFVEATSAQIAARLAPTFGAASAGSKAAGAVTFTALAGFTATGAMLVMGAAGTATVADTATASAILYSAGTFGASRALLAGDTLAITYTGLM